MVGCVGFTSFGIFPEPATNRNILDDERIFLQFELLQREIVVQQALVKLLASTQPQLTASAPPP
jgi:hypothetical protein